MNKFHIIPLSTDTRFKQCMIKPIETLPNWFEYALYWMDTRYEHLRSGKNKVDCSFTLKGLILKEHLLLRIDRAYLSKIVFFFEIQRSSEVSNLCIFGVNFIPFTTTPAAITVIFPRYLKFKISHIRCETLDDPVKREYFSWDLLWCILKTLPLLKVSTTCG